MTSRVEQIQLILPQTQCTRCGFDGCLPYAQAIAAQTALHNRCHPGGATVIKQLSALLEKPVISVAPEVGECAERQIAWIDDKHCIGCTLCLPSCPVDAIVGGPKRMHTVDAQRCTGCGLCLAPCPVDCIEMIEPPQYLQSWSSAQQRTALNDYGQAQIRRSANLSTQSHSQPSLETVSSDGREDQKQSAAKAALAAALQRANSQ